MVETSEWYSDPANLLEELRRGERADRKPLQIEGYDELREIRRGGQGVVYRGVQRSTRREVAVKVLLGGPFASESRQRRFEREIDVVAQLRHSHIVSIYDSGITSDDRPFLVMEYVKGLPLDEYAQRVAVAAADERSGISKILALFLKICDAVQYAHQHGVIHRDLKPSNIRVDEAGEPRVLDFGLAKVAAEVSSGRQSYQTESLDGQFLGSLAWASPEQAAGRPSDVRSDVYSLGVLLYSLLTEHFPYDVEGSMRDVLDHIMTTEPARPSSIRSAINEDIGTIILKCLAKDPDRRYQSVVELARDIRRYLNGEPIEARRDSAWYVLSKQMRRYRTAVVASAVILVVSIVFAVTMSVLYARAIKAERLAANRRMEAETETAKATAMSDFLSDMLESVEAERDGHEVKVADVLARAAAQVDEALEDNPIVRASLLTTLGSSYRSLGRFPDAVALQKRALALYRSRFGESHAETLNVMSQLGVAQYFNGDLEAAQKTFLDLRRLASDAMGGDSGTALSSRVNLALVYREKGQLDEALQLVRGVLDAQRDRLGEHDRALLNTLQVLGSLLVDKGEMEEAESVLRRVHADLVQVFGTDHPESLTAANNLGLALIQRGKYESARTLFSDLVEAQTRVRGAEHPDTLTAMTNLAQALQHEGDLDEAEVLYRRVLKATRDRVGRDHKDTLIPLNNVARIIHDQGKLDQAIPLLRETLDAFTRLRGPKHPQTILAIGNLAAALSDSGDLAQAAELFARAAKLQREVLGAAHPSTLIARHNLAGVLVEQGRFAEAETEYRAILEFSRDAFPEGHWVVALFRSFLGKCLTGMQRYEEAEVELVAGYEGIRTVLGPDHENTRKAKARLDELYDVWNPSIKTGGAP